MTTGISLGPLRRDQYAIAKHPAKTKALTMGRRWGKSVLGGNWRCWRQRRGYAAWIAPTYRNSRPLWNFAMVATAEARQAGLIKANKVGAGDRVPVRRAHVHLHGQETEAIRSWSFHLIIIDEAAMIGQDAWESIIQPTMATTTGHAADQHPARGQLFYDEWQRGPADGRSGRELDRASSANPNPNIQRRSARPRTASLLNVPEGVAAEFVEDGEVFRNLPACTATGGISLPVGDRQVWGIDWGRHNDATVVIGTDRDHGTAKELYHAQDEPFEVQYRDIIALYQLHRPGAVWIETNGLGGPGFERLRDALPPGVARPFTTTAYTKPAAIDNLAMEFEQQRVILENDAPLLAELRAFKATRRSDGCFSYSAPQGRHDDRVMALAIARYGARQPAGVMELDYAPAME